MDTAQFSEDSGHTGTSSALLLLEEAYPTKYWLAALPLLAGSSYDFTFATLHGRRALHDAAENLGMRSAWLDCSNSRHYPKAVRNLSKILRREQPSILHLNESIQASLGGIASKMSGVGVRIFHRHHLRIEGTHRLHTYVATKLSHMTMAVSQSVADQALREGADPDHVRVAHNGVAHPREVSREETEAIKNRLGIPSHHAVIVTIGLLREEKGQGTLLQAVSQLFDKDETASISVVLVGSEPHRVRDPDATEGAYARNLRAEAAHLGDRVHFVEHQIDTAPWFAIADIVAVPSSTETFGLVAAEAMASKCAIIGSDVDGLREVITNDETGSTVPAQDHRALAGAISRLLDDPALRRRYANAAYERYFERFTIEAMVGRWLDIYREATEIAAERSLGRKRRFR